MLSVRCQPSCLGFNISKLHWKDHFGYGLSQWEKTLHCNIISHWLCPYPLLEWDQTTLKQLDAVTGCAANSGQWQHSFDLKAVLPSTKRLAKYISSTRFILGMSSTNERRRYNVTSSLIGCAHTQNYLWSHELISTSISTEITMECKPTIAAPLQRWVNKIFLHKNVIV